MQKRGFDTQKYLKAASSSVFQRITNFGRFYLEVGGKLSYDSHASRVLPGYQKDTKIKLIKSLGKANVIYCISAKDIENQRIIHDYNLKCLDHALYELSKLKKLGVAVNYVIITRFQNEPSALKSKELFEARGIPVLFHKEIKGYPSNFKSTLKGISNQPYVKLKEKLVIITGLASGSGKMSVALVQLYNDWKKGINSGYAKIETFPIWNLPLKHPINLAYEAATADLKDKLLIDPFYYSAYKKKAVTYNRDLENFLFLKKLSNLFPKKFLSYNSPTEMGVGLTKEGIINENFCKEASKKEIIQRYFQYKKDYEAGKEKIGTLKRMKQILKKAGVTFPSANV